MAVITIVIRYITIGNAKLNPMLNGPLVDIIVRGIMATINAVIIAAIFNEAVEDTILNVIFKKTTENNTRWQRWWKI